jgi:hypothetical protein
MRPKLQKRRVLQLDDRIIPEAKRSEISPYYHKIPGGES